VPTKDTAPCRGCDDNFHNGQNPMGVKECWMLKGARLVTRWKLGWHTQPSADGAFEEVKVYQCRHETGRFAFEKELPSFAVNPRRLPIARRA
jgi:hypothetical protein